MSGHTPAADPLLRQRAHALRKQRDELLEALTALSRGLEQEIGSGLRWPADHACAECVPGGDIVVAGFRCGRHAALAAIAKAEREKP